MSLNNNKSIKIIAYFADSNLVYKEFISMAEALKQRNTFLMIVIVERVRTIRYALEKNKLILNKYYLRKFSNKTT